MSWHLGPWYLPFARCAWAHGQFDNPITGMHLTAVGFKAHPRFRVLPLSTPPVTLLCLGKYKVQVA